MPRQNPDYHINWSTKNRMPLITPQIEPELYSAIERKARELGARVHALDGTANHVHLVVRVPARLAISNFVGQVKGYSSHCINAARSTPETDRFDWQDDYEVEGIDHTCLERVIRYVQRQKEHHAER